MLIVKEFLAAKLSKVRQSLPTEISFCFYKEFISSQRKTKVLRNFGFSFFTRNYKLAGAQLESDFQKMVYT